MKNSIEIALGFALLFNAMALLLGLFGSASNFDKDQERGCWGPKTRLEFMLPGYQAGCWLGQPINEKPNK